MKKSTNKFLRLLFLSVMLWMTMSAQGKAAELAPVQEEEAEFARENQAQEKEAESALQEGEVSPVTEGLVWQEDHYVLYEGGAQVTAEGWKELSIGIFYIDSNGFVTAKMEAVQGNWNLYYLQSGTAEWQQQKNLVCRLHDGKMYYFDARGIRDTIKGWKEINSTELYYVDDSGSVASKLEQAQGVWRYYSYSYRTAQWEMQQNLWKTVGEKEYYFDEEGKGILIYDTAQRTCQQYRNGEMSAVKREVCRLSDGRMYYFDTKGICVVQKGWQKVSAKEYVNIGKKGYVVSRIKRLEAVWKYDKYNYAKSKWQRQKNTWKIIDGKEYYFNKTGISTRIYTPSTRKCLEYKKGRMQSVRNKTVQLRNGKLYYFNSRGIRTDKKGWKVISDTRYVEVGKKGYITSKMEKKRGIWRYYSYRAGKWKIQKSVWKHVRRSQYYFNASGNCTRIYNTVTRKCYDVIKGKMVLVKNNIRQINKTKYYFDIKGVRGNSAGMYLTSSGQLIYADEKGRVIKEISGQVLSYEIWEGKITNCKVQEGNFICYYNSDGSLRRKIDMNGQMVALTYDDGPSQYTPAILEILRQHGGVATFFVVGQRVSSYADTIRSAYNMGCEIGNHTYSHQVLTKVGVPSIQSQVNSTNAAVQNVTGASPIVMRPPGGGHNPVVRSAVGMPVILWSIDTLDWKTKNASSTQAAVLNHVKDGDIILMHDLYNPTAEASRVIIPELVRRGYQLVTVSELADCRGGMAKGAVYNAFRR
ncbi:MAG: polysaccharide deacetylase family protein [Lachnospiraceae bacterium]|nr:polysaccharide deacetylase family protein [Lachnospiraceae bacterium]